MLHEILRSCHTDRRAAGHATGGRNADRAAVARRDLLSLPGHRGHNLSALDQTQVRQKESVGRRRVGLPFQAACPSCRRAVSRIVAGWSFALSPAWKRIGKRPSDSLRFSGNCRDFRSCRNVSRPYPYLSGRIRFLSVRSRAEHREAPGPVRFSAGVPFAGEKFRGCVCRRVIRRLWRTSAVFGRAGPRPSAYRPAS
mgnify:CR=1 FL=1